MERNGSYKTAYAAAYARLIEQYEPEETRLFNDSFVKYFFGKYLSFIMQFQIVRKVHVFMYNAISPGLFGLQVCRTKYIDDKLEEAINNGIEQVVILGAGLDTRLYRIQNCNKIKGFEIDLPIMQDKKKLVIKKYFEKLSDNVVYISINFNTQTLEKLFENKKLDPFKPIFFIWEGVTQYITKDAVENTLEFISKASFGSKLVFTYVLDNVVNGTGNVIGAEALTALLKTEDQDWCFGLNQYEVEDFIRRYKLQLIEDVGVSYYKENYLKPMNRNLDVSSIERIVYAQII